MSEIDDNYPVELVESLLSSSALNYTERSSSKEFFCEEDEVGISYGEFLVSQTKVYAKIPIRSTTTTKLKPQENYSEEFFETEETTQIEIFLKKETFRSTTSTKLFPTNDLVVDFVFGGTTTRKPDKIFSKKGDHEDNDYESLCTSTQRRVIPSTLPNILNKLVTVAYSEKLVQTVWIEECT